MRFALIGTAPPLRGGIAQYNASLCEALSRQHETLLLSFSRQYPDWLFPARTQRDEGPQAFPLTSQSVLDALRPSSWRAAAGLMAEFDPDAVLFQWWHPFFAPCYIGLIRRLRRLSKCQMILFCHNFLSHECQAFPGRRALEFFWTRRLFQRMDGFLMHTRGLQESLDRVAPQAPSRVVRHPVYDFYSRWDPGVVPHRHPPTLLFFGNIRPYKGLELLLEALALLPSDFEYRLIVAGDAYFDLAPLQKAADDSGLGDRISWNVQYVPNSEVPGLFRSADVVVLPYLEATQSGIVPLAYHFDAPVIATDVGGLSDVVLDGRTGLLVPPGRPEKLADAILRFFREQRRESFQKHIQNFRQQLSWDAVTDSILSLCEEISRRSAGESGRRIASRASENG